MYQTPEPERRVHALVRLLAAGLTYSDIYRQVPWMNRANLSNWLSGRKPIRLSERAIDQVIDAIAKVKSNGERRRGNGNDGACRVVGKRAKRTRKAGTLSHG